MKLEPQGVGRERPARHPLRRIELSDRRRALNQGNLGPPHPREVKLCLRESAGARSSKIASSVSPAILRTSLSSCSANAALEVISLAHHCGRARTVF
jgi:hypothetical protein